MGKLPTSVEGAVRQFIEQQHVFFVATAPLAGDEHVNLSPKGLDSFRILGPTTVAYLDLTGSGVETIAHLRENQRIVIMFAPSRVHRRFCAFTGLAVWSSRQMLSMLFLNRDFLNSRPSEQSLSWK